MQLRGIFDVEDADVRVMPDYPPQMTPSAGSLQLLSLRLLVGKQLLGRGGIQIARNVDVHSDVEQREVTPPAQQAPS